MWEGGDWAVVGGGVEEEEGWGGMSVEGARPSVMLGAVVPFGRFVVGDCC